ncbi:fumarylacetoacetate hydrolase family protein [Pulveribacter sp.]|uniref:fumarylacetoacetate hydrolase family protein n=1 Tax=Pulveribacter sp. TaxID=2678893 RepID=UPI0028AF3F6D|nr:fumarylacetoacetate hydrolase family protein [Pulveribacter sp.]
MKLATYKDGSRDGQLVVVSRDLSQAHYASGIASRLQQVLDDWNFLAPQLADLSAELNSGRAPHAFAFEPERCLAPLPRAHQWVQAMAYPAHVQRLRQALGVSGEAPLTQPPLLQGASDDFLGACDALALSGPQSGLDFGAQLAVATGDVQRGAAPEQAREGVRLVMLANAWAVRPLMAAELAQGFGPVQSLPATAFSPVAVTPDELGEAWQGGRVQLQLQCAVNGRRFGMCEAGQDMAFDFGQLLAHLSRTRRLRAGTLVGSGPVANAGAELGHACIADKRAVEASEAGRARTGYLRHGDSVRIEMKNRAGHSVFGAIDQDVAMPD